MRLDVADGRYRGTGTNTFGEVVVDIRRKIFEPVTRELFSFLVEEFGFGAPTFSDGGGPTSYVDLEAVYTSATFTVSIRVYTWYGGENGTEVYLRAVGDVATGRAGSRVAELAESNGLAKARSIPAGARTGFEMRRALTAHAATTRQLLERMAKGAA